MPTCRENTALFVGLYHDSEIQEGVDSLLSSIILNKTSYLLNDNFLQNQMGDKLSLFQVIYIRSKIKICKHFYG